jgi:hypothetical protein
MAFFSKKTNVMIKLFYKTTSIAAVDAKSADFLTKNFDENILKIITSTPVRKTYFPAPLCLEIYLHSPTDISEFCVVRHYKNGLILFVCCALQLLRPSVGLCNYIGRPLTAQVFQNINFSIWKNFGRIIRLNVTKASLPPQKKTPNKNAITYIPTFNQNVFFHICTRNRVL